MVGDVAVLRPKGKLMGGPETVVIHDKVREMITQKVKEVVIDLGGVRWMNSAGLGTMIGAMISLRNAGGDLKFANIGTRVDDLLTITKLTTIFETYESVEQAVLSFRPEGGHVRP